MKKLLKISLLFLFFAVPLAISFADGAVNLDGIGDIGKVKSVSNGVIPGGGDALVKSKALSMGFLHNIKVVLSGVFLIYLIYAGFMMVMAMGAEDKLSAAKRQIYYSLLGFMFLNIPGEIYNLFVGKEIGNVTEKVGAFKTVSRSGTSNIILNFLSWNGTIEGGLIAFVKTIVIGLVIMLFIMGGIGLISSGGNEDKRKKVRTRFINGLLGLVFLGVIQSWVFVAYDGNIPSGQTIFAKLSNMALFFTGPIAIFFLIYGGFLYISSAGDEGKAKKGITIIKNTVVAAILLLGCYAFLKDLADFSP